MRTCVRIEVRSGRGMAWTYVVLFGSEESLNFTLCSFIRHIDDPSGVRWGGRERYVCRRGSHRVYHHPDALGKVGGQNASK